MCSCICILDFSPNKLVALTESAIFDSVIAWRFMGNLYKDIIMLAGSDKLTKKREDTTSPAIQTKLNDYLAEQSLHAPTQRVFKQVELKEGQAFYHRSLFGGLAGFAFLSLLGAGSGFYMGYSIMASVLLCLTVALGAVNFWLTSAIPEVKISAEPEKPPVKCSKTNVCPPSPTILFRGVPHVITHEPTQLPSTTPTAPPAIKLT